MPKIKIGPAVLSHNPDTLQSDISEIEDCIDLIQVDIMDDVFVPNKTPGPEQLKLLNTKVPIDLHLMVKEPNSEYLDSFLNANPNLKFHNITVHAEACKDLLKTIDMIKSKNVLVGIAINPKTKVDTIKNLIDKIDIVLVMTVEPGFSGQSFMEEALTKIPELRKLKPELDIQVDGGITDKTAAIAAKAGANVFVANSYIFKADNKVEAVNKLRDAVQ